MSIPGSIASPRIGDSGSCCVPSSSEARSCPGTCLPSGCRCSCCSFMSSSAGHFSAASALSPFEPGPCNAPSASLQPPAAMPSAAAVPSAGCWALTVSPPGCALTTTLGKPPVAPAGAACSAPNMGLSPLAAAGSASPFAAAAAAAPSQGCEAALPNAGAASSVAAGAALPATVAVAAAVAAAVVVLPSAVVPWPASGAAALLPPGAAACALGAKASASDMGQAVAATGPDAGSCSGAGPAGC